MGAGVGGLTAGALLAKAGKKVLVAEREQQAGGYARGLRRGPYEFDTGVHQIMGGVRASPIGPGLVDAVLLHLGVRDRCELVPMSPMYRVRFPGLQLDVPTGREAFLEAHLRHFPGEAPGLRRLVELSARVCQEVMRFPIAPRPWQWPLLPLRYPGLARYAGATLGQVLDRHLADPKLKTVYATLWPYVGLPPSRASFAAWALMMASLVEQGGSFCKGGFQRLVDAFAGALTRHGGQLLLGRSVERIRIERRRVRGVTLRGGEEVDAPLVISNADARSTFGALVPPDQVPGGFLRRLRRMEPSVSVHSMYLGTDLDVGALGVPAEMLRYELWDHERIFHEASPDRLTALNISIPSAIDPSLAPKGQHVCVLSAFAGAGTRSLSPAAAARLAEAMLGRASEILPGLRDHITFVEGEPRSETPFPLHSIGPIYGWAASPGQTGTGRPANRTPISGLFIAGHWAQPSHGILMVVASGLRVARLVLGVDVSRGLIPLAV